MAITKDIKTAKSVQEIQNLGFDTEFNLPVVETLVYNPTSSVVERMTQPATSISIDTLNSLIETLQELTQRLEALAGTVANTAQLRVVQTSVPSTAVTGPITSAQSIAEKAVGGISYAENMAITNLTAVQSNINNTIGA